VAQLHEWIDPNVRVTLLADRGFGDKKLYEFLGRLGWDFVIRFRAKIAVTSAEGVQKTAAAWISASGRATMLRNAFVTANAVSVPAVVVGAGQTHEGTMVPGDHAHRPNRVGRGEALRQAVYD
jgi:hypothetical protein